MKKFDQFSKRVLVVSACICMILVTNAFLPNPFMSFLFQENLSEEEIRSLAEEFVADKALASTLIYQFKQSEPRVRSSLAQSIGQGNHKDELAILKELNIPIAIIHGVNDKFVSQSYLSALSAPTLWENKIHLINNASHFPNLEEPNQFNRFLQQFCGFVFGNQTL